MSVMVIAEAGGGKCRTVTIPASCPRAVSLNEWLCPRDSETFRMFLLMSKGTIRKNLRAGFKCVEALGRVII